MWQWWNCAADHLPPGFLWLRLNLDETSVCLFQGGGKGTVCFRKRPLQDPSEGEPVQKVSRNAKRTCVTHIALVRDRPGLQPFLPQVIIGNEHTFHAKEMAALIAACPPNVYLIRQKSAWNNAEVCKRVFRLLGAALRAYFDPLLSKRLQPALLMDACRAHLKSGVAAACLAEGIWPIIVPAKLTWLLQPLDTHVFLRYKAYLRTAYQSARLSTVDGELPVAQFLQVLYDTIRQVMQGRRWARAFDEDGVGQGQAQVSKRILRRLRFQAPPAVPAVVPGEGVLKLRYPRGAKVPSKLLLRPFRPPVQLALPAPAVVAQSLTLLVVRPLVPSWAPLRGLAPAAAPISGPQTRSQSRLLAALAGGRPLPRPFVMRPRSV